MEKYQKAAQMVVRAGLQFGIVLIVLNLLKFFFKLEGISVSLSLILWALGVLIYSGAIAWIMKNVRDKVFDGYLGFNQCVSYGVGMLFIAALASGFISFIYFQWVDPYFLGWRTVRLTEMVMQFYTDINAPQDIMDTITKLYEEQKVPSATEGVSGQFFSNVSLGFIVSLLAALILQKREPLKNK